MIGGVVVDDAGTPVANVLVNAAARRMPAAVMSSNGVDGSTATSTNTDARGQFTIADLPAGEYSVWPGGFDQPPFPADAVKFVTGQDTSSFMTIAKTGDKAVRLVMPRSGRITGKITFADTGAVVDDFKLDVQPRGDRDGAVAGEHGHFDLRDVRPGTYALHISGRGFLDANRVDIRVDAGQSTDAGTITVDRGRTLRGKVVDTAGRGISGARVMVGHIGGVFGGSGRFDEPDLDQPGAFTDADGGFAIIGGVQNQALGVSPLVVGADHSSYGRSRPVAIPPGAQDPQPITLTLLDCGSIAGKVTQNGKPVANAMIGAGWPEFGFSNTNEDGEFVMSRLPVGPVALRVHNFSETGRSHQLTVEVEAGKQTEVTIEIPVGTIKLSVDVKPKAGADVAGALLFLFRGAVTFENYAQLSARLFPEAQGFARWEGDPSRPARFEGIVPDDYTVCTIPLAWSPNDKKLMKRVSGDRALVRVYCAAAHVSAAPVEQTLTVEVPSMAPLP
ncbi:MAG: hypothetical protein JWO36_625 [Myxococcales bacterium]|nr:hypothetical protein [Myxococcales bacterium]